MQLLDEFCHLASRHLLVLSILLAVGEVSLHSSHSFVVEAAADLEER
jgi:hypothetical protein